MASSSNKTERLFNTFGFWFATLSPVIVAFTLACIIANQDGLSMAAWNRANIETAYLHFKLPLLIASLAFPLGAVIIANHRSVLTLEAMKLQSAQNIFANYYVHLDRFTKAMGGTKFTSEFPVVRLAHDALYPSLRKSGSIELDVEVFNRMQVEVDRLDDLAASILSGLPVGKVAAINKDSLGRWIEDAEVVKENKSALLAHLITPDVSDSLNDISRDLMKCIGGVYSFLGASAPFGADFDANVSLLGRCILAVEVFLEYSGDFKQGFSVPSIHELQQRLRA